jgi:hypothetical protein
VKAGLKVFDDWDVMEMTQDSVLLLRRVKGLCCRFDATKQNVRAIITSTRAKDVKHGVLHLKTD